MAYRLLGKNVTAPDLHAKVTGKAKYAEDFRADGMVFCRLLTSPMPHARVRSIDASEALALDGVVAILTADELPEGGEVAVLKSVKHNKSHYGGLQTCGSVWSCPVCSAKVSTVKTPGITPASITKSIASPNAVGLIG